LLTDNCLPIQEQVIRRILRRAIRYGFTFEYQRTFIYQLVAILADQMGEVFLKSENNKV
jgi:alanyl-tRNA synthetase